MTSVFIKDILETLLEAGLKAEIVSMTVQSNQGARVVVPSIVCTHINGSQQRVMPLEILDVTSQQAQDTMISRQVALSEFKSEDGSYPLIISRDRWERQHIMTVARLFAHLGIYQQIYARNCEVSRIDKPTAAEFLNRTHSYGDASCRYRYGLYLKRHTGHIAQSLEACTSHENLNFSGSEQYQATSLHYIQEPIAPGTLVAVATFSGGRRWQKGDKIVRSHEWTRYASLPQLRLSGGMGKLLKHFIKEENPDDIMSYADLEWSEGAVYEGLGFKLEAVKEPVLFAIDPVTWQRIPLQKAGYAELYHQNFGSFKYRKILTEYQ